MRARDVPASVRRAYEIAGKQYPGDFGPHTPPAPPSPRSNRAWERHGAHSGGPARSSRHRRGHDGFIGFGRELEVLALICIVACVPLLGGVGRLPSSRLTRHDLRQATGFVAEMHRDPAEGWTERQRKLAQREGHDDARAHDGALGRERGADDRLNRERGTAGDGRSSSSSRSSSHESSGKKRHPALLAERVTRESDPRATPGTCAATAPPRREVPSGSGTAWRSEAGTYGAGRPFRRRRRAKIAAARASPSPTAAGGSSSRMPACAGSRGGGRASPRRTRAARARTCGPAGTRARARLRERRRISRSRRRRGGVVVGVRGDGSRGG